MEFYQLKSFSRVAETGNLTKAAKELNTTPPSVSSHIKSLEDQLGVALFERTTRGMIITPNGENLLTHARQILDSVNQMKTAALELSGRIRGHLQVGINTNPDILNIPKIIKRIHKDHPDVTLEIKTSNSGTILKEIRESRLDTGFVFGHQNFTGISCQRLTDVEVAILVPKKWENRIEHQSWETIAGFPWIRQRTVCPFFETIKLMMHEHNLEIHEFLEAADDITQNIFIEEQMAVVVVEKFEAERFVQRGTSIIWQPPKPIISPLFLIHPDSKKQAPVLQIFLSVIREIWHEPNTLGRAGEPISF